MLKTKQDFINKIHLIISVLIVVPVAIIYGFKPELLFDIYLNTTDEHHVFKAIMSLYLGFSFLWVLGIFNIKFLKTALISNIVFMLGIGSGRLLSLVIDGMPSLVFVFGTIGELVLGFYGLYLLKRTV